VNPNDINCWASWAVLAIFGHLQPADTVMRENGPAVRRAAALIRKRFGAPARPLFRGVLLDAADVRDGMLPHYQNTHFVSFTEDEGVARWFADPDSTMSSFVRDLNPTKTGWVAQHTPRADDILFHYSWREHINIAALAREHPLIDDVPQFAWNLATQSEVIVTPYTTPIPVAPYVDDGRRDERDEKYTYPPALDAVREHGWQGLVDFDIVTIHG